MISDRAWWAVAIPVAIPVGKAALDRKKLVRDGVAGTRGAYACNSYIQRATRTPAIVSSVTVSVTIAIAIAITIPIYISAPVEIASVVIFSSSRSMTSCRRW